MVNCSEIFFLKKVSVISLTLLSWKEISICDKSSWASSVDFSEGITSSCISSGNSFVGAFFGFGFAAAAGFAAGAAVSSAGFATGAAVSAVSFLSVTNGMENLEQTFVIYRLIFIKVTNNRKFDNYNSKPVINA